MPLSLCLALCVLVFLLLLSGNDASPGGCPGNCGGCSEDSTLADVLKKLNELMVEMTNLKGEVTNLKGELTMSLGLGNALASALLLPGCSAVWVKPSMLLTAAHCAVSLLQPPLPRALPVLTSSGSTLNVTVHEVHNASDGRDVAAVCVAGLPHLLTVSFNAASKPPPVGAHLVGFKVASRIFRCVVCRSIVSSQLTLNN